MLALLLWDIAGFIGCFGLSLGSLAFLEAILPIWSMLSIF